jgi:hypothetical protein
MSSHNKMSPNNSSCSIPTTTKGCAQWVGEESMAKGKEGTFAQTMVANTHVIAYEISVLDV